MTEQPIVLAIDFELVVRYEGDVAVPHTFEAIHNLMEQGYAVYIISNEPFKTKRWIKRAMKQQQPNNFFTRAFTTRVIWNPFVKKYRHKPGQVGITRMNLDHDLRIIGMGVEFTGVWRTTMQNMRNFKNWKQKFVEMEYLMNVTEKKVLASANKLTPEEHQQKQLKEKKLQKLLKRRSR